MHGDLVPKEGELADGAIGSQGIGSGIWVCQAKGVHLAHWIPIANPEGQRSLRNKRVPCPFRVLQIKIEALSKHNLWESF